MKRRNPADIPRADRVDCAQCSDTIDARAPGVAQRVTGWRINRSGGGANMIALPETEPKWLCQHCLDKRRSGLSWDQLSLFGDA